MRQPGKPRAKRVSKRYPVRFGPDEPRHVGFLTNVSLTGLQIQSITLFQPPTVLQLSISAGPKPIDARGVVRWAMDVDHLGSLASHKKCMGVELLNRPESYADFVLGVSQDFKERRTEQRFQKTYRVVFERPKELLEAFTQNISAGGVYIVSNEAPPLHETVDLRLVIAENMWTIRAKGRVVYSVPWDRANETGMNPGFAVQFEEFFENGKEKLEEYIRDLKARIIEV